MCGGLGEGAKHAYHPSEHGSPQDQPLLSLTIRYLEYDDGKTSGGPVCNGAKHKGAHGEGEGETPFLSGIGVGALGPGQVGLESKVTHMRAHTYAPEITQIQTYTPTYTHIHTHTHTHAHTYIHTHTHTHTCTHTHR